MEIDYELARNMFKDAHTFSIVSVERGDVLAPSSPIKERDT